MGRQAKEISDLRDAARDAGIPLIGDSTAFLELLVAVERVTRRGAATVLIRGETGTGKELIARAVHYLGERADYPFVPVNCGTLPESLVENELFGHRPGAFTGASHESVGLVRLAHGGTLLLDEVDSLPQKAQVALLRFLQDGCFRPLGAAREEHAEVRVVAASNRCLEEEVRTGRFREDLYFRLNLMGLELPPLRERTGDVKLLAAHFLQTCAQRYGDAGKRLDSSTLCWFERHRWPGNVRELENLIHRHYLLSDDDELHIEPPLGLMEPPGGDDGERALQALTPDSAQLSYRAAKSRALQEFDRAYLTQMVRRTRGNVTQAAMLAGKERRAFGKLLKRYQITHEAVEGGTATGSNSTHLAGNDPGSL